MLCICAWLDSYHRLMSTVSHAGHLPSARCEPGMVRGEQARQGPSLSAPVAQSM